MFWSHGRKTNGEGAPERDQVLPDQPVQSPNTCRQPQQLYYSRYNLFVCIDLVIFCQGFVIFLVKKNINYKF